MVYLKVGRRAALVSSTMLMALPSLLIGVLPTYKKIGIWSTYALVLCRMLQASRVQYFANNYALCKKPSFLMKMA